MIRRLSVILGLLIAPTLVLADGISVQPVTFAGTVGESFTLTVDIAGASDLYGYQFDLGFDPTILAANSVTEGSFLAAGGATIFIPGTIDNVGGLISSNADILDGAVSGVDGGGTLIEVSFQALAAGSSTVQVFNLFALDSFGLGLDLPLAASTVTVTASAASPVPEPASVLLLGTVAVGLLALIRRRSSRPTSL